MKFYNHRRPLLEALLPDRETSIFAKVRLELYLEVGSVWVRGLLLLLPALLLLGLLDVGLLRQLLLLLMLLLLLLFTQYVGDGEGYRLSLLPLQLCPWLGVICNGQCYL